MSSIVEHAVEIDRPVETVFAYVDDFSKTREWMFGLEKIDPVTEQRHGVGATYDGVMKLGVSLRSRIRCTGYEENRLLEISSVSGIKNTQRWTFSDLGNGRTRVEAWISYTLPGGPAGKAMAAAVKPFVGVAIKHTSEALVRALEEGPR